MTVAVSKAVEQGAEAIVCASTGNTAASAAAYGARAGLPVLVLVPEGAVAGAKLAQVRMLGARVLEARGSFDEALRGGSCACRPRHARPRQLAQPAPRRGPEDRRARDRRGARRRARTRSSCRTAAAGTRPRTSRRSRSSGSRRRSSRSRRKNRPATLASAIRIAEPVHAPRVAETGARILSASDDEIVEAWRELAEVEGVFCEPSSAAGLVRCGEERFDGRVVATLTGHGLKDVATADRLAPPARQVDPDPDAIAEAAR